MTIGEPRQLEIDSPTEYKKLTRQQQEKLRKWIQTDVVPHKIKSFRGISSYAIKHIFEETEEGFYITNGQMKGAMQEAGLKPRDERVKNWEYPLSVKIFETSSI